MKVGLLEKAAGGGKGFFHVVLIAGTEFQHEVSTVSGFVQDVQHLVERDASPARRQVAVGFTEDELSFFGVKNASKVIREAEKLREEHVKRMLEGQSGPDKRQKSLEGFA